MGLPIDLITIRLFLRIFLGIIFLSVGISKLAHPRLFHQGIQEYRVIPFLLEKMLSFSLLLSFCIPGAEIIAGFGLISGFLLTPSAVLAIALFFVFSVAMALNLVQGRNDLSCHCEGALGNHKISWWLVGRNLLLMVMVSALLITTPDQLTLVSFLCEPKLLHETFLSTIAPVALVVGVILILLWLFNYARTILHIKS